METCLTSFNRLTTRTQSTRPAAASPSLSRPAAGRLIVAGSSQSHSSQNRARWSHPVLIRRHSSRCRTSRSQPGCCSWSPLPVPDRHVVRRGKRPACRWGGPMQVSCRKRFVAVRLSDCNSRVRRFTCCDFLTIRVGSFQAIRCQGCRSIPRVRGYGDP